MFSTLNLFWCAYDIWLVYLSVCTYSLYLKIKKENENTPNFGVGYQLPIVGPNQPMIHNVPQLQQAHGYAQVPTQPQMYMQNQAYPQQQQFPQAYPQVPAYQQPQAEPQPPTYHETSKFVEANQSLPKV